MILATLSIPFLAVRVAYSLATMFLSSDSMFMTGAIKVLASAFLQYLMEFRVTSLFLYAGVVLFGMSKGGVEEARIELADNTQFDGRYSRMPPNR